MKETEVKSKSVAHKYSPSVNKNETGKFFNHTRTKSDPFFGPDFIQPKLKIGRPDDKYEKEADHIADQVMRMPDTGIQRKCRECEDEEKLQKKTTSNILESDASFASHKISNRLASHAGQGSRLQYNVQKEMEQKIGADFGGVHIHTGSDSIQLNRQLGARAFTHGRDIFFNKGEYNPASHSGKHLLAHELTHVVQQSDSVGRVVQMDNNNNSSTTEGDKSFEFNFELLPPSLKFTIGNWMLQANTGSAQFQFSQNLLHYSLGYSYGGNIFAGFNQPGFGTKLGVNPSSGETSLNINYDQFRFGGSFNPDSSAFGLNIGYGAPLLPMPSDLSESVYSGWGGATSVLGDLGNLQDPISFYQSHRNDVNAVMGMVHQLHSLSDEDQPSFGAGLKFKYNPETGLLIGAGMQWKF